MTAAQPDLDALRANPDWERQPLFDRSGWSRVRFGDVVTQLKEKVDPVEKGVERYVAGEHMETENVHIRKWGSVGDGYLGPAFIRGFRKGQVLYGSRRTYLKKVAVAKWDGVTANTTFVLESKPDCLLPELLPWLMLSARFTQHSVAESKGSTNPYINFPDIAKFEFDLPPLEQQRRLANILWAIDQTAVEWGKVVEASDLAIESLVDETIDSLICDYGSKRLAEDAEIRYGLTLGKKRQDYEIEAPYLRVANVGRGFLNLEEIKSVNCKGDEIESYQLCDGDVLVVEGHASVAEIGRSAIWRGEASIMLHQNHLIRARPTANLDSQFLNLVFNSSHGRSYFRGRAKSSSGLNTINSTVVKGFPIPRCDMDSQLSLVEKTENRIDGRDLAIEHAHNTNFFLATILNIIFY